MPDFIDDFMKQRSERQVTGDELLPASETPNEQRRRFLERFLPLDYSIQEPCKSDIIGPDQIKNN